jgi:hypothetical protein
MNFRRPVLGIAFVAAGAIAVTLLVHDLKAHNLKHHLARLMVCFHRAPCARLQGVAPALATPGNA